MTTTTTTFGGTILEINASVSFSFITLPDGRMNASIYENGRHRIHMFLEPEKAWFALELLTFTCNFWGLDISTEGAKTLPIEITN